MLAGEGFAERQSGLFQIGGGAVQDKDGGAGWVTAAAVMQPRAVDLEKFALWRKRPPNPVRNNPAADSTEQEPGQSD